MLFKVFPFGAIESIISKPGINDKFKTAYEILMKVVNLLIGFELKFTCDNLKNAPLDTSRIESVSEKFASFVVLGRDFNKRFLCYSKKGVH